MQEKYFDCLLSRLFLIFGIDHRQTIKRQSNNIKEYYKTNKEDILEQKNAKQICKCGIGKTKKHKALMGALTHSNYVYEKEED